MQSRPRALIARALKKRGPSANARPKSILFAPQRTPRFQGIRGSLCAFEPDPGVWRFRGCTARTREAQGTRNYVIASQTVKVDVNGLLQSLYKPFSSIGALLGACLICKEPRNRWLLQEPARCRLWLCTSGSRPIAGA